MFDLIAPLAMIACLVPVAAVTGYKAIAATLHPTAEQTEEV